MNQSIKGPGTHNRWLNIIGKFFKLLASLCLICKMSDLKPLPYLAFL